MSIPIIERADALRPVLVASHPRSGTHLVMDLLRRQFPTLSNWRLWGLPLDHLYLNLERLGADKRRFSESRARTIVNRPRRALMKTHFDAAFLSSWAADEAVPPQGPWRTLVDSSCTIYIVRHPMDVMASYKQFLAGIDPNVNKLNLMNFICSPHWNGSSDRLGWWQAHVDGWAERKGVLVLRYEDVVRTTEAVLARMSAMLDEPAAGRIPYLPSKITSIARTRMDRMLRLAPESTAIVADRDRFSPEDWRRVLTAEDRAWIVTRIGPELVQFGYALDPDGPKVRRAAP